MITEPIPNAARLMRALRSSGYDNITAVSDLIDNAIDAGAKKIGVSVTIPSPDKTAATIIIADDGCGMSEETLDQAMRLGSKTEHMDGSDLGKFGMGLITASISIGKILTVITKKDGVCVTAKQDLDKIYEEDKFICELRPSEPDEAKYFDMVNGSAASGTILIISNCDYLQYDSEKKFTNKLRAETQRIFRKFLSDGVKLIINNEEVFAADPMFDGVKGTFCLKKGEMLIANNSGIYPVEVRAVMVPDFGAKDSKAFGINLVNQGFYLMRNGREIASGRDLGIFKKHNDFNRLRIEVSFSSEVDDAAGINFAKHEIKPNESFIVALIDFTKEVFPEARRIAKNGAPSSLPTEEKQPATEGSRKGEKAPSLQNDPSETQPSAPQEPLHESGPDTPALPKPDVDLTFVSLEGGHLVDSFRIGNKTLVKIDATSDFYKKFIEPNRNDKVALGSFKDFVMELLGVSQG